MPFSPAGTRPVHHPAVAQDVALGILLQSAHGAQQRGLATSGSADQGDELAGRDIELQVLERMRAPSAAAVVFVQAADDDFVGHA
jgi:hypothetical protein